VVWFRDVALFSHKRVLESDVVKQALDKLVAEIKRGVQEGIRLVIGAPRLDRRSSLYRVCASSGTALEYAVPDKSWQQEGAAREQLRVLVRDAGLSADEGTLQRLLERAGTDTRQLAQEVEKIRVYLGDETTVTEEAIRDVVSPAKDAIFWDLQDAMGARNAPKSIRILRRLLYQGQTAVTLVFCMESRLRELLIFRSCLDRDWCRLSGGEVVWQESPAIDAYCGHLAKDPTKYHPIRAGRLAGQARNYNPKELLHGLEVLIEAHHKLVSSSVPGPLILEFALLRIVGGNT
jgi:DNA polymerase-3 subunit delta